MELPGSGINLMLVVHRLVGNSHSENVLLILSVITGDGHSEQTF